MRVLVTRASEDAARTARRLAALGHEPVLAPVTRIAPTGDPAPQDPPDALVITSAHAGPALRQLASRSIPVFAVGHRSAEAAREAGFATVIVGSGDALALAQAIRAQLSPGRMLLHVTGRHRKDEPAASLQAAGYRVTAWEAYEAVAAESLPPALIEGMKAGRIDAVLHYSRRSAEVLVRLADQAGVGALLKPLPHLCLSADVAAPLVAIGAAAQVAAEPTEDALLAALP